jgi:hypothetical protein
VLIVVIFKAHADAHGADAALETRKNTLYDPGKDCGSLDVVYGRETAWEVIGKWVSLGEHEALAD